MEKLLYKAIATGTLTNSDIQVIEVFINDKNEVSGITTDCKTGANDGLYSLFDDCYGVTDIIETSEIIRDFVKHTHIIKTLKIT